MKQLRAEIEKNFDAFTQTWKDDLKQVITELDIETPKFFLSYLILTSMQAWRSELLEQLLHEDALAFYLEAQNDAVTSHYLARQGCWRPALKALRSCIENVMQSLYYYEHPVELKLWHQGKHFLQRAGLIAYLESHPNLIGLLAKYTGLTTLGVEYTTLNNAVHASAKSFRMTADAGGIQLATNAKASLGAWTTRERHVIRGINFLLMSFFADKLKGAAYPNLRMAISFAIPVADHAEIKKLLGISLFTP
jgi:hypothetical protein